MAQIQVYRHSGGMGNGLWKLPLAAIPFALITSIVYGYACAYNPVANFAFLLPLGFGALLGWRVSSSAKAAYCRNSPFVFCIGLLTGLAGLYASWVVFLYALGNRFGFWPPTLAIWELFLAPSEVWNWMDQLSIKGWFTIGNGGSNVSGITLQIAWASEALTIVGFAAFYPVSLMGDSVFCEKCGNWCKEKDSVARLGAPKDASQKERIKNGDLSALGEFAPYEGGMTPHTMLDIRRCESCGGTETVRFKNIWYEPTKKGLVEKSNFLSSHLLLDAEGLNRMQAALAPKKSAEPETPSLEDNPPENSAMES